MNTRRRRLGIYSALHFSRRSSTSSKVDDETSLVSRQQETIQSGKVKVLSQDPLVYIIPNLLSKEECLEYQQYVKNLQQDNDADVQRPMTKSNPPAVSLDLSKLWPLPFLSLAAGIPPVVRLFVDTNNNGETSSSHSSIVSSISINEILSAALPNIAIALTVSGFLAFGLVLPLLRWYSASYSRTSYAMALNQPATKGAQRGDFEMIRPLVHRVSALTRHSWEKWEAPVVTRYDVGAIFARHGDASPTKGSEWQDLGGQRVVTCICYLNTLAADDSSGTGGGGETYFEKLNLAVSPKAGDGLVFFPSNSITWEADDRTTHESLPPTSQEKWIVQLFGRAQRVPPPLGLDDSYGNIL